MIRVVGHRGAAGLEPENTLRSIRRAIELGVDQIEVDARVTKDRRLVVIHDETVDRTTDGHGHVKDLPFDELRRLDAGKGESIPTLREVLGLTKGEVVLQIELKVKEAAEPVVKIIEEMDAVEDVVITSFMHELLEKVHQLDPDLRTGALFYGVKGDICQRALDVQSDTIHVYHKNLNADLVGEAHGRGLKVEAWNPDEEEEMKRVIDLGVDVISSNRPDILLNLLRSMILR
ncbi:MAG: glycerophosphodiester phosphodiesterase family protein [Candidatus Bathyarchaeota archaeon]|nr:glycerophosphodiester phosphodiesterase family protein [Candidatus Bathyarchaeota archaeon]